MMSGGGPDGQLNRLRNMNGTGGMMMTEYNPNYEFGGGSCTIQDLKEIPRENLRLVKYVFVVHFKQREIAIKTSVAKSFLSASQPAELPQSIWYIIKALTYKGDSS